VAYVQGSRLKAIGAVSSSVVQTPGFGIEVSYSRGRTADTDRENNMKRAKVTLSSMIIFVGLSGCLPSYFRNDPPIQNTQSRAESRQEVADWCRANPQECAATNARWQRRMDNLQSQRPSNPYLDAGRRADARRANDEARRISCQSNQYGNTVYTNCN
jgi:hypothetical protein